MKKRLCSLFSLALVFCLLLSLAGIPAFAAETYAELTVPNGDFELGNGTNWTFTGYSEVKADQWNSNTSNTLTLWLSDDAAMPASAGYSVILTPGSYYFTFDVTGAAMDSGLGWSVSAGDTVLARSGSTVVTSGWNVWATQTTDTFTLSEETEVTFALSGTQSAGYWGNLDNLKLYGTGSVVSGAPDPVEADIYVPYIQGTDGDFIRGLDVSSLLSVLNSGAVFYDWDGNALDGQGFMNLAAASGTNWIRLRVWNDPFDANGNGYGGGNCDVAAAVTMGQWATNAGMRVLIDFHYSDFWADPGKQQAPKAWADFTVAEKETAIYDYTYASLKTLLEAGVDVGMVQVGNETTNSICGVSAWEDRCKLFQAGSRAVRAISQEYGLDIQVAIHFTNPERAGNYATFAKNLDTYGVDYDIFASSWYPYWHGTLDNLTSVLKNVADTYGKQVLVAETSWAYTLEDGDGHDNTVRVNSNDSATYPFSVQGQADELAAVAQAVKNVGDAGIGMFYWEAAWIPVQVYDGTEQTLNANKALWERYGSGWAASYAGEYDAKDAGVWYGGSAVDNQALFAFDGAPLESLKTYLYMQTGTSGFEIVIVSVEEPSLEYTVGDVLVLPETLKATYSYGEPKNLAVTWDATDVAAVDMNTPGVYTVRGTVDADTEAICNITVRSVNLLKNPGMEESDMSMYAISQTYAKRTKDDPHSGTYSLHFYNSGIVDFTAEQTVTLEPGHYEFSLFAQGGNIGENPDTYAYVKLGEQVLTRNFSLTGWCIWENPVVCFDVAEEMDVTVGVNVTATQTGAWGTIDDWYLCKAAAPAHSGGTATCVSKAVCTICGQEYGGLDGENHAGYTSSARVPTCDTDGLRTYTCTCGHSYSETIPATGHSFADGSCTVCGAADPDYVAPEEPVRNGLQKGDDGEYYYYVDGKVASGYTGLVENAAGRWYIKNGHAELRYDGLITCEGTKYLIKAGRVNTGFTGISKQEGAYCYFTAGVYDLEFEGLVLCNGMKAYVENGQVNFNKTGIVEDAGQQVYVKYGIWRNTFKGLARDGDGNWHYFTDGVFDASYTGVAKLNALWVYVQDGHVNFHYTGVCHVDGVDYAVKYGVVQL